MADLGEGAVRDLVRDMNARDKATPGWQVALADPLVRVHKSGGKGFTPARRAILLKFVSGVMGKKANLARAMRPQAGGFLYLCCNGSFRVESQNRVVKHDHRGVRVTGKGMSPSAFVQKTLRDSRAASVRRSDAAAYAADTAPTTTAPGAAAGALSAVTQFARRVASAELEKVALGRYTCGPACSCGVVNGGRPRWEVRQSGVTTSSRGPWLRFDRTRVVTMNEHGELECTCLFWDDYLIPCAHVLEVLINVLGSELQWSDMSVRWANGLQGAEAGFADDLLWGHGGRYSESWREPLGPRFREGPMPRGSTCDGICAASSTPCSEATDMMEVDPEELQATDPVAASAAADRVRLVRSEMVNDVTRVLERCNFDMSKVEGFRLAFDEMVATVMTELHDGAVDGNGDVVDQQRGKLSQDARMPSQGERGN